MSIQAQFEQKNNFGIKERSTKNKKNPCPRFLSYNLKSMEKTFSQLLILQKSTLLTSMAMCVLDF
jgi:hypothetical protein